MARVVVDVMLKPEILDPQGQAVASALPRLGVADVAAVRIGRRIELEFDGDPDLEKVNEVAHRLLANPVIEDYTVTVDGEPVPAPAPLADPEPDPVSPPEPAPVAAAAPATPPPAPPEPVAMTPPPAPPEPVAGPAAPEQPGPDETGRPEQAVPGAPGPQPLTTPTTAEGAP